MEFVDRVTLSTLGPAAEMFARHASPAFMTFQYFPKTAIAVPRGIVNTTIAARRRAAIVVLTMPRGTAIAVLGKYWKVMKAGEACRANISAAGPSVERVTRSTNSIASG